MNRSIPIRLPQPELGQAVRAARLEAGLSQAELARATGLTDASYIRRVERGVSGLELESLVRVARATGSDLERFLREGASLDARSNGGLVAAIALTEALSLGWLKGVYPNRGALIATAKRIAGGFDQEGRNHVERWISEFPHGDDIQTTPSTR